ncbi:MAG: GNAT family N-acetyltransferase [Anaerolineae bacterium]|nr:GNAT family N-acetyltransferase [Anaerolineae bacterium]
MLAVTQVNDCLYCNFAHTRWALAEGVTPEEIERLAAGAVEAFPPHEAVALCFAQHYAESGGNPDPGAWARLVDFYGEDAARAIIAYIRMITMGNLLGNTFDYVVHRVAGYVRPGARRRRATADGGRLGGGEVKARQFADSIPGPPWASAQIGFRRLRMADLPRMRRWLNAPHVRAWYDKGGYTYADVVAKYAPRIRRQAPTDPYTILYGGRPIGYIQTYKIADYPGYAAQVQVEAGAAGVDLFIGEAAYMHRGLGRLIMAAFLKEVVFEQSDAVSCIVDPDIANVPAIRMYESAGFKPVKRVGATAPGEPGAENLVMRISREEVLATPAFEREQAVQ